jgi:hypothetical protein
MNLAAKLDKVKPELKLNMQSMLASLSKTGKIPNVKKKDIQEARATALAEIFAK